MPDGNILLSFRNISTVVMIDRRTGEIYWKLGAPPLSGQHAPYMLANGHLLLFDNGPHRLDETLPFSRVLEIDPATKDIVWKFQEQRTYNFFSARISNAQRLPNGNTLINEGLFGRFFEVTAEGAVVWEYVNPYFDGAPRWNPTKCSASIATAPSRLRGREQQPEQTDFNPALHCLAPRACRPAGTAGAFQRRSRRHRARWPSHSRRLDECSRPDQQRIEPCAWARIGPKGPSAVLHGVETLSFSRVTSAVHQARCRRKTCR
jgi:hypothetical protein